MSVSQSTGLPIGISRQLRMLFDMAQDPKFVQYHNDRLRRMWEKSNPDHPQVVYTVHDIIVRDDKGAALHLKPLGKPTLHHQFFYQAQKEHEYFAALYLGRQVSASYYVRHYQGGDLVPTERWVFIERRVMQLDQATPEQVVAAAANDSKSL